MANGDDLGFTPAAKPDEDLGFVPNKKPLAPPPTMGQQILGGAKDFGAGALKGLMHTGTSLSPLINKIPGIGETLAPSQGIKAAQQIEKPSNTMQKVGYGAEQVGEFMLPTGAEEKGGQFAAEMLPKLGKYAAPAGRVLGGAVESGLKNKAQGSEFGSGAVLGGVTGIGGEVGRAVAPGLAESALGVGKKLKGFGRTPGEAALKETAGLRPATIAESARDKLSALTSQLEAHAAKSTVPTTTAPAVAVVDQEIHKAMQKNSKSLYDQLTSIREQLTTDLFSGKPHGAAIPASKLLNLKRGIGDLEKSWNPEQAGALKGIVRKVYRAMDDELDRAVPAGKGINQRISSLIPVASRAESTARGADLGQRVMHRVGAHTGALVGAAAGGALGHRYDGTRGT